MIKTAMVMAAGLGTRMRPLTNDRCKALVEVSGKTLINHMLDRLADAGVERAVVNVHAFADKLEAHLKTRTQGPKIIISDERESLLETGGGLVKALPLLGNDPIFVCNIDAVWLEFAPVLQAMVKRWNPMIMDELFLLAPREDCLGYAGSGDFDLSSDRRVSRRAGETADWIYAGVQILNPAITTGFKPERFSRNKIWDESLARNAICGLPLPGYWMHVGDPRAREAAQAIVESHTDSHV